MLNPKKLKVFYKIEIFVLNWVNVGQNVEI